MRRLGLLARSVPSEEIENRAIDVAVLAVGVEDVTVVEVQVEVGVVG